MIIFQCYQCQKQSKKSGEWIKKFGNYCSVECAQKHYEDEVLQEELMSSNPTLEGLESALDRMI